MPSDALSPVIALSVAANERMPSSVSLTLQVAAGTDPLLYVAPPATPATATTGAVFDGAGAVTSTLKVTGARLNVPSVVLLVWEALIVVEPTPTGVTVSTFVSPQLVKVTEVGLTVATPVLLDATVSPRVVCPVKLHPDLPASSVGLTYSVVVPVEPPTFSGKTSATASVVVSRLLEMSSATATPPIPNSSIGTA